jgi:hypothetical protein
MKNWKHEFNFMAIVYLVLDKDPWAVAIFFLTAATLAFFDFYMEQR